MSHNTITTMGRVEIRDLATVCRFLKKKGLPPKTQSDLLRKGFEVLANSIEDQVTDNQEAADELRSVGITFNRDIEKDDKDKKKVTIEL